MASVLGLLTAMFCFVVLLTGTESGPLPRSSTEGPLVLAGTTQRVAPGQSIQAAIDAAGQGGTVVIGAGVHTGQSVIPADDMVITGEAGAVLDGSGAPRPFAIYGSASNVTISHLEIRNYAKPIWGENNYRHQGAIHGSMVNDGGGFVAMARNWRIDSNDIHNNAGWGVSPGDGFTVVQNALHHNGMAGIGGGDFNGGLFEKNDIYSNNDPSNSSGDFNYDTGRKWDWAWNAAGIKVANVNCRSLGTTGGCSSGTPLIIRSNNVHDNVGVGIWCDINCNDVTIEKNLVERNIGVDRVGIFYEISQNGVIRDNVVRDQGASGDYLSPSGILVWSSDGVLVERNQVEGTANAIVGNARPREFDRTLRNLTVRDNVILTSGRPTRIGVASDTATDFKTAGTTFSNNYYDNPSKMNFWWTDISRGESSLTLDQWQALGFTSALAPPATPKTPAVVTPPAAPPAPATPATTPTTTPPSSTPPTTKAPRTTKPTSTTVATTPTTTKPLAAPTTTAPGRSLAPQGAPGSVPAAVGPAPGENPPVDVAPVDTAPEALAFDDRPTALETSTTTTARDASPTSDAPVVTDGPELGIGVTIDEGPPSDASAILGILRLLGMTLSGVAVWLGVRSIAQRVGRRSSSQV